MDGELFARNVLDLTRRVNDIQARLDDAADTIAALEDLRAILEDTTARRLRHMHALAAQRDRLLAYVHADDRLRRATLAEHEDAYAAWYDARRALIDAGDITEDDVPTIGLSDFNGRRSNDDH